MVEGHVVGGINLLDMVPRRRVRFKYRKGGLITILVPRFRSRFGMGICRILNVTPYIKVHLDRYGTYVWSLCNGRFTVRDISERMVGHFGTEVREQGYERLATFLRELEAIKAIDYL